MFHFKVINFEKAKGRWDMRQERRLTWNKGATSPAMSERQKKMHPQHPLFQHKMCGKIPKCRFIPPETALFSAVNVLKDLIKIIIRHVSINYFAIFQWVVCGAKKNCRNVSIKCRFIQILWNKKENISKTGGLNQHGAERSQTACLGFCVVKTMCWGSVAGGFSTLQR